MKTNALIVFAFVLFLFGCKSQQSPVISIPVQTVERRVSTLIPFFIPGDSTTMRAYFECDSLNNVLLTRIEEAKSKNIATGFSFQNGVLNYDAKTQPDTVYLPSDTIYKSEEIPVPVEVVKTVNILTKWQNIRMRIGDGLLLLLAAFGIYKAIKWYLNSKKL